MIHFNSFRDQYNIIARIVTFFVICYVNNEHFAICANLKAQNPTNLQVHIPYIFSLEYPNHQL